MALHMFRDCAHQLDTMRPSRLLDQHFGLGLAPEDLLSPLTLAPFHRQLHPNYFRPWRAETRDIGSTVHCDKDKFHVTLDVQQFAPEEINVKVTDGCVTVHGKHEEKPDEHGYIARQFVRRYIVPKEYKVEEVASSLSSDGVLTISAPKNTAIETQERSVPIKQTGPHKVLKDVDHKPAEK